jgi:hypothetical protein
MLVILKSYVLMMWVKIRRVSASHRREARARKRGAVIGIDRPGRGLDTFRMSYGVRRAEEPLHRSECWRSPLGALPLSMMMMLLMMMMLVGCGEKTVDPDLSVSARPRFINNAGQVATIGVTATDALGKPGTGEVRFSSAAGSLATPVTVALVGGEAEVDFSCSAASDPGCVLGAMRVTGEWLVEGKLVENYATVTITAPDAGAVTGGGAGGGGGGGGGTGGGAAGGGAGGGGVVTTDGGPGSFDGGTYGTYRLAVAFEKVVLVKNTGDRMVVTATLTESATGAPVSGATVSFTTTGGSFAAQPGTSSLTAMTNASGVATETVYVADAATSFRVTTSAFDATAYGTINVLDANQVTWTDTTSTLTIASTGRLSSTIVHFRVTNASAMPMPNVDVVFQLGSSAAAGARVTPIGRTDAQGIAQTTLNTGEGIGQVSVDAIVSGTEVPGVPNSGIRGSSGYYSVIVGRPSDKELSVQCVKISLGALQIANPPRTDLRSECTATVIDRNGNAIPFPATVNWYSEVGNITSTSVPDTSNNSKARATFYSGGAVPFDVPPLPGEQFFASTGHNPRDNFITIIAAVSGEEQFWDGSSSVGVTNGKWDPGEWFVDLPEPFVDANDNQRYDPGESFVDTWRVDCANPTAPPTQNKQWDGPNGCWDSNAIIWRPTHVVYTDALVGFSGMNSDPAPWLTFVPALPLTLAPGTTLPIDFGWTDSYFNRLSADSIIATVTASPNSRGTVSVTVNGSTESFGHDLVYEAVRATESAADSGVFAVEGPCDRTIPDAGYPLTRCLRQYRFADWLTEPLTGRLTITAPTAQAKLPDGGTPPDTISIYELKVGNSLSSPPASYQFSVSFQ